MRYEHLLVGRDETGIGTIVMNRPERRNALSEAIWPFSTVLLSRIRSTVTSARQMQLGARVSF